MAVVPKFSLVQDAPPNMTLGLLRLGLFLVSVESSLDIILQKLARLSLFVA